jgi:hypothetical protein
MCPWGTSWQSWQLIIKLNMMKFLVMKSCLERFLSLRVMTALTFLLVFLNGLTNTHTNLPFRKSNP